MATYSSILQIHGQDIVIDPYRQAFRSDNPLHTIYPLIKDSDRLYFWGLAKEPFNKTIEVDKPTNLKVMMNTEGASLRHILLTYPFMQEGVGIRYRYECEELNSSGYLVIRSGRVRRDSRGLYGDEFN